MFNNENGLMRRRCYPDLRSVLMIACLFLWAGTASAQDQQEISGTVTDAANGEPLPGANITVVDEPIGTSTNVDGEYSLEVPADAEMLRVSFIGYEAQEVAIEGRSTIDFALVPSEAQLDELVVIGYGTQEERDVTGSVESVRAEDFNQAPVVSPENLISGKVAGVQISSNSGAPGDGTRIRVRGSNSFSAGNDPLFVIDGVPIDNGGNAAQRNPLNFLNPNDIASMTVLKDASATAIYGSRGANGVILIETKQAGEDEGRITYDGSVTTSSIADRVSMMDASQYRNVVRNDGPQQAIGQLGRTSTDWQDLVERQAFGQEHSLSFARGYEDADFRLSLGYLDQEGTLQGSSTERITASFKYNQQFWDDALSITANLRGSQTQDQFEPGGMVGNAASFNPTVPVRDVGSPYGGFFEWEQSLAEKNPLAQLVLAQNEGQARRSLGNVEAEYQIPFVEGLSARLNVGYDVQEGEQVFFAPTNLKEEADSGEDAGTIQRRNFSRTNELLDAYLTYDNEFDSIDSRFDVTAGYSYQNFVAEFPEFEAFGLDNNIFGPNSTGPASEAQTFTDVVPNRLISGFGRVNYTFADRYLATVTVRRDGSSRFGPENQWGTFPSVALGWRANEEPFMDDVDFVSNLRLRLSWGITGNQEIGNFGFEPLYTPGDAQSQVQFGDRFITTLRPSAADEALKWEEKNTYNIGVNFGFFDELVSGSFEVYREDTEDLLRTIPVAAGANLSNLVLTNIGEVRNQGVEGTLNLAIFRDGDFTWDAQFNAAYNENEILKVSDDENFEGIDTGGIAGGTGNTVQTLREGESLDTFFLYEQEYDENGDPIFFEPGSEEFQEKLNERRPIGNPNPDWIIGHTSQFAYENFDATFSLRAHIGNDVYNNNASNLGHLQRLTDVVASNLHTSYNETGFSRPQYFSDLYLEDASFLRLDNASVGYTLRDLPGGVSQLRVYGSASNLFTITGYSGPDPEVSNGIDNNLYPRSRTFTAGINLQF